MQRPSKRSFDQIRPLQIIRNYNKHAEGSVLIAQGDTKVICTVSIIQGVPRFLKDSKQGWLTAEYGMLPRSTGERMKREAVQGKQSGRTLEISRLIARSMRAALDLTQLQNLTLQLDCDVIQADGGTRCAAITGSMIALNDALNLLQKRGLKTKPFKHLIAAVSVGIYQGQAVVDLDYVEDSSASTDLNLVMTQSGGIIEIQGTAEQNPFSEDEFKQMLSLGKQGLNEIFSQIKEHL